MDDLLVIGGGVLAVIVIILTVAALSQRERWKRFEARFGVGGIGFAVELHEEVKREVARVSLASMSRMARIDRQLIEFWEREKLLSPEDGAKRLSLFEAEVTDLETKLAAAFVEDQYQLSSQLRGLYWEYLRHARAYWASSPGYHAIRARVMQGLTRIEALGEKHDRSGR